MYHAVGGRDHLNNKYNEIKIFNNPKQTFQQILLRWKFYLYQWEDGILRLRDKYPWLSYYTINDIRFICEQITSYRLLPTVATLEKITAKFTYIDRNMTKNNVKQNIRNWQSLDESLYESQLAQTLKDKFDHTELNHEKLIKLIESINLYKETTEFITWMANDKNVNQLPNFESHLKDIQNSIQKSINFSSDINNLLNVVPSFNERIIFSSLGEYLSEAFDVSADKMINIVQNVLQSLTGEYGVEEKQYMVNKEYHEKIIQYFSKQAITGNTLKSMSKKQFEISLVNWIGVNNNACELLR
eukprot:105762_1